jgi:hypothetical protein
MGRSIIQDYLFVVGVMNMSGKCVKQQQGYILPFSLVIMMFGAMVVGSLMTYCNAHVNSRAIARDNLEAYYGAESGIQLTIAKLIQADYTDPDSGEITPLPQRFDFDGDEQMEIDESSDYYEYYTPTDLFPSLSGDVMNDYEVRITVEHLDMVMPDYVEYRITAYAFELGASNFSDKVVAIVLQRPYPIYEAWNYSASIISWQRQ